MATTPTPGYDARTSCPPPVSGSTRVGRPCARRHWPARRRRPPHPEHERTSRSSLSCTFFPHCPLAVPRAAPRRHTSVTYNQRSKQQLKEADEDDVNVTGREQAHDHGRHALRMCAYTKSQAQPQMKSRAANRGRGGPGHPPPTKNKPPPPPRKQANPTPKRATAGEKGVPMVASQSAVCPRFHPPAPIHPPRPPLPTSSPARQPTAAPSVLFPSSCHPPPPPNSIPQAYREKDLAHNDEGADAAAIARRRLVQIEAHDVTKGGGREGGRAGARTQAA